MVQLPVFLDLSADQYRLLRDVSCEAGLCIDDVVSALVAAGLRLGAAALLTVDDLPASCLVGAG